MKSVIFDGQSINPSKVVCAGRNFTDHIKELNNEISDQAVFFIKPNSSISNEIYSRESELVHYEGEISFLIRNNELSGVGFGIDLTRRELQTKLKSEGLPWERAKSFDNSAVFSAFVPFHGELSALRMELTINDNLVQSGGCDMMLNQPDELLKEAKTFLSFEDGDLLMCGTPKGVGPVNAGDRFNGKIYEKEKLLVEHLWTVK
jgi:2-keto-4-pentenoate hydratase/2-oxohepta-3-ene-1,7-dioic acid hydratase in catechol pathway